jgi:alkylation response protein AidB-like acyl-CoA dehydrogenase
VTARGACARSRYVTTHELRYSSEMDFSLDADQELIVQTVRRFADRDLRGWAADADRAGAPPDRLATVGAELGFFLDAVPAAADGLLDGPYGHVTRALRGFELGHACAGLAAVLEANVEPRRRRGSRTARVDRTCVTRG